MRTRWKSVPLRLERLWRFIAFTLRSLRLPLRKVARPPDRRLHDRDIKTWLSACKQSGQTEVETYISSRASAI